MMKVFIMMMTNIIMMTTFVIESSPWNISAESCLREASLDGGDHENAPLKSKLIPIDKASSKLAFGDCSK